MDHAIQGKSELHIQRAVPILPVRDVRAALALYQRLGFQATAYDEGAGDPVYGFLAWGDAALHLARVPDLDPASSVVACYLYVSDADALFASWQDAGIEGRLIAPSDTPYGLREFAYIDPDGNLLRVGAAIT